MNLNNIKIYLTALILISGIFLGIATGSTDEISARQSEGLVIDYGNWNTLWTDVNLSTYDNQTDLLIYACEFNDIELTISENTVISIDNISNTSEKIWDFWTITNDSNDWVKSNYEYNPNNYKVCAWAYCSPNETPSIGVDSAGNSIYGYGRAMTTVSMSPATTEIIGSLNAVSTLVGVDQYSNYPESVVEGKASGDIAIIGGYSTPSYELILKTDADVVFGDDTQFVHRDVCKMLNADGKVAVLLYEGVDIDTILNNIFIVGTVMGYGMTASKVINNIEYAIYDTIEKIIFSDPEATNPSVIVSLSGDKAPWVAGSSTYINDSMTLVAGENVLADKKGWAHIGSETIANKNPQYAIIVLSHESVSEDTYKETLEKMSNEWKSTDAYKNGNIFILYGDAADLASRQSPRVAQLTEILARILQSSIFDDYTFPKLIGDDYEKYLTYTEHMGYKN